MRNDTSDGMVGSAGAGEPDRRGSTRGAEKPAAPGGAEREGPTPERLGRRRTQVIAFLRANPQVFVLLVICVVLGLGTFLAVLFGLLTAGSGRLTGEPSGAI